MQIFFFGGGVGGQKEGLEAIRNWRIMVTKFERGNSLQNVSLHIVGTHPKSSDLFKKRKSIIFDNLVKVKTVLPSVDVIIMAGTKIYTLLTLRVESIQNYHLRLIKVTIVERKLSSVARCSNLESRLFDQRVCKKNNNNSKKRKKKNETKINLNRAYPHIFVR